MSEKVEITYHGGANGGEYRALVPGSDHFGRLTWVRAGQDVWLVDHTIVPPAIGGRGIAAQLVEAIVADARDQGFRIIPQCSYVAAQFRRHPEWMDLLAK